MKTLSFILLYSISFALGSKGIYDIYNLDACMCQYNFPRCCSAEMETFICDCAPKPVCKCDDESELTAIHDKMLKSAMKDAFLQQDLAHQSKLQVELFQKAQEYAKEVGQQEMKAKQYAKILNDETKKAHISRMMMFKAVEQVKLLSEKIASDVKPMQCVGPKCLAPGAFLK